MSSSDAPARTLQKQLPAPNARVVPLLLLPAALLVTGALLYLRLRLQPPTVPVYVLAGAAGAAGEVTVTLPRGGTFAMELRPTAPVEGAVGARGFLLRGDVVRPWEVPFVVERDGTVLLAGRVDGLFAGVPPGEWDIAVAVGRPENLPTAPRDVLRAREDKRVDEAWHLVIEHGRLEP